MTRHRALAHPATPTVGDPVVVDGVKYRAWLVQKNGTAQLRTPLDGRFASVRTDELGWDAGTGVWRPMVAA